MPASNIVIADATGTPVNHTFVPIGLDPKTGVFWWTDQSQDNPLGYWKISAEVKKPPQGVAGTSSADRNNRVKVTFHEPVLANVTNSTVTGVMPAPVLSHVPRSFHEFVLPERSTKLERQHLRKMSPLILQNAQIIALLDDLAYPGQ